MTMMPPEPTAREHARTGVAQTTHRTLLLNLVLSTLKLLLGLMGQSQTLVADAVHSISDCISDVGILVGVRYWSAPADERHPYGHWHLEALTTIAMGISLTAVAGGLVVRAFQSLQGDAGTTPAWYTLLAALLTVGTKETMFHWTRRKARKFRSRALEANAWHQRSDAFSSLPAAAAIAAAMIFPKLRFIDPAGAVIVSVLILVAAIRIIRSAIAELMDESLPPQKVHDIANAVRCVPGVTDTHKLRTRRSGPGFFLDLHVLVSGDLTVRASHEIADTVRQTLIDSRFDILDAVVHIEPDDA